MLIQMPIFSIENLNNSKNIEYETLVDLYFCCNKTIISSTILKFPLTAGQGSRLFTNFECISFQNKASN